MYSKALNFEMVGGRGHRQQMMTWKSEVEEQIELTKMLSTDQMGAMMFMNIQKT